MKIVVGSLLLFKLLTVGSAGSSPSAFERDAFVRQMEGAVVQKKREARLTSKLMARATPVADPVAPRFLEEYQDFGVNLTEYALKYIGCQNVHQYSDELAEDEESTSVLGMNRFVVLRLCPKDSCSDYNHYGCNYGFGEYVIQMEEYLQIMSEEYFEQYMQYCETCYYCMHKSSSQQQGDDAAQNVQADDDGANANANGDDAAANGDDAAANGDDAAANGDDDAAADDAVADDDGAGRRGLAYYAYNENDDYYYKNADFYNNMDDQAAQEEEEEDDCADYYQSCQNYRTACKDYSQYATNMEEFFECAEFNVGNTVGYMGPHCRSDGITIGIGLYKDQYCNEYNSDMINLSGMLGMDLGDENLKAFYSESCISCLASDGYVLDQDDQNEVTPICGALYDASAKCNLYMGNDGDINSYSQEKNENSVCSFISSLITNTYDEYGSIYLESGVIDYFDVRKMSKANKYALSGAALLVLGLALYACYLHRVISKSKYSWYPKGRRGFSNRGTQPGNPAPLERMHSGIIQGRSRSGRSMELNNGAVYA